MASAEIPKEVFDVLIHEQIAASRYADSVVRDTISLLNKADREIAAKILGRGESETFTAKRLDALLKEIKATVYDSYSQINSDLADEMGGYALHQSTATASMLATQLPVSFSPVAMTADQLAAIVSKAPISIGPDKKLLLEEVFKALAGVKEEAIRGALRLGMVEGETVAQMTRRLQGSRSSRYSDGIFAKKNKEAEKIVRTVVNHTGNQAAQATFKANEDVVKGWVYVSTLDSRTCSVCYSQSGKTFPLGQGPIPARHVSCRCFAAPEIKTWRELGINMDELQPGMRASKSGPVKADISFQDWLKTQPKSVQVELLGKTRAQMFADGKLTIDKFTDASGKLIRLSK